MQSFGHAAASAIAATGSDLTPWRAPSIRRMRRSGSVSAPAARSNSGGVGRECAPAKRRETELANAAAALARRLGVQTDDGRTINAQNRHVDAVRRVTVRRLRAGV